MKRLACWVRGHDWDHRETWKRDGFTTDIQFCVCVRCGADAHPDNEARRRALTRDGWRRNA